MLALHLQNVRCFTRLVLPLRVGATVLIGDNGAGKTTVAESLASLCPGPGEGLSVFPGRDGAKSGRIALQDDSLREGDAVLGEWLREGPRRPLATPLLAYGRYRRVWFPDGPRLGGTELLSSAFTPPTLDSLLAASGRPHTATLRQPDNALLPLLEHALRILQDAAGEDARIGRLWAAIEGSLRAMEHGLEGIEKGQIRRGKRLQPLGELSDGYQAVLVIVLDMVLRYHSWFGDLPDPLHGAALVVIDELDLHLHPRWQRRVVRQLLTLFPVTTFLITTHAPAIVQGAIDDGLPVYRLSESRGASRLKAIDGKRLRGAELETVAEEPFDLQTRGSVWIEEQHARVDELLELVETPGGEVYRDELITLLQRLSGLQADEVERHSGGRLLRQMLDAQRALLGVLQRQLR